MLRGALGRVGAGALGRQVARGVMSGAGAAPQGVNGAVNGAARPAPPGPATGGRNPSAGLTGEEKFLFDAAGYFVARQVRPPHPAPLPIVAVPSSSSVRTDNPLPAREDRPSDAAPRRRTQVFSPAEVEEMKAAVEAHEAGFAERKDGLRLSGDSTATTLTGDGSTGRKDLGGCLGWPEPYCQPFRRLLHHPGLIPYIHSIVGSGYRLDHMPLIIRQEKGAEGFHLHGGSTLENGDWDHSLTYGVFNGEIRTNLLGMTVQLTDVGPGDGGFAIMPGSHKANFPCPKTLKNMEQYTDYLLQPETKAGDVVFFSEAASHGTMAWNADHTRTACIIRFAPSYLAYGRAYTPEWSPEMLEGMTDAQRAVLQPPYHERLDRPVLNIDGTAQEGKYSTMKKNFNEKVFKNKYY